MGWSSYRFLYRLSDMSRSEIIGLLTNDPFEPFRVITTSGQTYAVNNPALAVPMKSKLFIALPDGDSWTIVSYLHLSSVDALTNGRSHRPRRKRNR